MVPKKPDMVNVFIRDENLDALLIHNIGFNGDTDRWEFTGGKVRDDEDLEKKAIDEAFEELGIKVRLNGIFGDYKTQTPEGDFLCRTYFGEIVEGKPKIKEKKHDKFDYFSYKELESLAKQGSLVPNLRQALPKLKEYMR